MFKIFFTIALLSKFLSADSFSPNQLVGIWELRSYKTYSKMTFLDENVNTNKSGPVYALFTGSGRVMIKGGVSQPHNWYVKNGLLYTSKSNFIGYNKFRSERYTDILYIRGKSGKCLNVSFKKRSHAKYWNKKGFVMCKISKREWDFMNGEF